jgi:AAA family ATP:ADP antiporter
MLTLFFASNLVLFWCLQPGLLVRGIPSLGIVFYLWVGVFNVFVIAQFWAFAADLYSDEAGKRQFPLIAVGATAGAAAGAGMAKMLVPLTGTYGLLLVAALLLSTSLGSLYRAEALGPEGDGAAPPELPEVQKEETGGLRLIFRHRYLVATAMMILVLNWVNSNGENFLFGAVQGQIHAAAEARGITAAAADAFVRDQTTQFYGDLFFWVNLVALLLQTLVASRVLRYGGFAAILFCLPLISFASYTMMALVPTLAMIRLMKIAENSADYSLNNTAKQVLWLPTTTEMKYRAKAAIDTLFVRSGDGLAAVTAFLATNLFVLPLRELFLLNALLVAVWLALAAVVAREHARLSKAPPAAVA